MSVHGCPSCGGVWLGTECARRFSMELPPDAIELAAKHSALALESAKTLPLIDCPVCGMRMQRTHAAAAKLDLDYCDQHGTWYDRNELGSIARVLSRSQWNRSEPPRDDSAPTQATSPGRRGSSNDNDDVIDMAAMGLGAAIDVANTAVDTAVIAGDGEDVVGGILGFFSGIFD
jgi:Zn-finger nucleic acid-binding protein